MLTHRTRGSPPQRLLRKSGRAPLTPEFLVAHSRVSCCDGDHLMAQLSLAQFSHSLSGIQGPWLWLLITVAFLAALVFGALRQQPKARKLMARQLQKLKRREQKPEEPKEQQTSPQPITVRHRRAKSTSMSGIWSASSTPPQTAKRSAAVPKPPSAPTLAGSRTMIIPPSRPGWDFLPKPEAHSDREETTESVSLVTDES